MIRPLTRIVLNNSLLQETPQSGHVRRPAPAWNGYAAVAVAVFVPGQKSADDHGRGWSVASRVVPARGEGIVLDLAEEVGLRNSTGWTPGLAQALHHLGAAALRRARTWASSGDDTLEELAVRVLSEFGDRDDGPYLLNALNHRHRRWCMVCRRDTGQGSGTAPHHRSRPRPGPRLGGDCPLAGPRSDPRRSTRLRTRGGGGMRGGRPRRLSTVRPRAPPPLTQRPSAPASVNSARTRSRRRLTRQRTNALPGSPIDVVGRSPPRFLTPPWGVSVSPTNQRATGRLLADRPGLPGRLTTADSLHSPPGH
jgi:hypothetical protein